MQCYLTAVLTYTLLLAFLTFGRSFLYLKKEPFASFENKHPDYTLIHDVVHGWDMLRNNSYGNVIPFFLIGFVPFVHVVGAVIIGLVVLFACIVDATIYIHYVLKKNGLFDRTI